VDQRCAGRDVGPVGLHPRAPRGRQPAESAEVASNGP
jgi:hypothetical protein